MYVYKITNTINNKIYIGQCSKSLQDSKNYFGSGKLILSAIEKYGIENFSKTILCECNTKKELNEMEIYWIDKYQSNINGYNISIGGNGGNLGDIVNDKIRNTIIKKWSSGVYDDVDWSKRTSHSHTKETIQKIKNAQSGENGFWYGVTFSNKHKENISKGVQRAFRTDEVRNNFIEAMRSDEVRKKISDSLKGNEPWNKGKTNVYTDEQIQKMRNSAKNRNISDEMEKQRRSKISKHFSENHPNRIQIKDNRDGKIYDSIKDFCSKTNTSWYKTKGLRQNSIIEEISYDS